MINEEFIVISVPRAGRTLTNFLNILIQIGAPKIEIEAIKNICNESKKYANTDFKEAEKYLKIATQQLPCFGLFIDKKRDSRPYRVGLLSYQTKINGITIKIEGDEPHNSASLLRFNEVDLAVVGYDDLLIITQGMLSQPTLRTKWGMYNNGTNVKSTRIAGSANLSIYNKSINQNVQDFVGFFLISRFDKFPRREEAVKDNFNYLKILIRHGIQIYVKARYLSVLSKIYPELKLIPVEDVEDAVQDKNGSGFGLEIVQSGSTIDKKNLYVYGAPYFLSESLYVANLDRYNNKKNESLKNILDLLNPQGYFDAVRIENFIRWHKLLSVNLKDRWFSAPTAKDMFCTEVDMKFGLLPYTLKTTNWEITSSQNKEYLAQAAALISLNKFKK